MTGSERVSRAYRMLAPDRIGELAARFAGLRWSWSRTELDRVVRELDWAVATGSPDTGAVVLRTHLPEPDEFATVLTGTSGRVGAIEVRITGTVGRDRDPTSTSFRRDAFVAAHQAVTRATGPAVQLRPGPEPAVRWTVPSGYLQLRGDPGGLVLALHSTDHLEQADHDAERDRELAEYLREYGDPLAGLGGVGDADPDPFDLFDPFDEPEPEPAPPPVSWAEFATRLTELVGRLPAGTELELQEASRPIGGRSVRFRQHPDRLTVGIGDRDRIEPDRLTVGIGDRTEPDRRLSAAARGTLTSLGWRPPDQDDPDHWCVDLAWPAPAAGYRDLVSELVTMLQAELAEPAELAQRVRLDNAYPERELAWSGLGLTWLTVRHLARVGAGETADRPGAVLRRIQSGTIDRGELFTPDGQRHPVDQIESAVTRGRLVLLTEPAVERVLDWWRQVIEWLAPVPPHPVTGLRRAMPVDAMRDGAGVPVRPGGRLVDPELSAAVRYLREAPLVLARWGLDPDPFAPGHPGAVPGGFRTDGAWVWPESLAYHLDRHGIPPQPDFLRYLARRGYQLPEVPEERLRQAADLLAAG